jgi:hypothetical protein
MSDILICLILRILMKYTTITVLFFLSLLGCTKDGCSKILLLKVDYMTNTFEGGHEQILSKGISDSDTIPIIVEYAPPGDFGNIRLIYKPGSETIFDGSIIWMGTGKISYPKSFYDPGNYPKLSYQINFPDSSRIQYLDYFSPRNLDYSNIWESINDLEIVSEYLSSQKKIVFFLYTPSVGAGDPNTWDWFVIFNK